MSHIIIGIHGLANKPPQQQHAQDWVAAIKEGLERNCFLCKQSINFDAIHWADINYSTPLIPDSEPYIPTPSEQPIKFYRDGWLSEIVSYFSDNIVDNVAKAREWLGVDPVTEAVLNNKLTDLSKYYYDSQKRDTLREMVKKAVKANQHRRITIIAHSMGSIIAYDALRELGQTETQLRVENFITIGSPLGLPTVAMKIHKEWNMLRTPSVVAKRWINLADRRDPVAFDTHLRNNYEANDKGVRVEDDLILNNYVGPKGLPNYHKIYGYLRCPEMSEFLRSIL